MGADSTLVGNVFTGTAITMGTNAEISGRAIAQSAVTCETACTIITGPPAPTSAPSAGPSAVPSTGPSSGPSSVPSAGPSAAPSSTASASPSTVPSAGPSASPSAAPSAAPSAGPIDLGACDDFALHAGSAATCAGAPDCDIIGGTLGVSPGTSVTGNFDFDIDPDANSADCARDGLATWKAGRATTGGVAMLAEMGGLTFTAGVYTHGSAINIAATNPTVTLDAEGDPNAVFIFNAGTTLTTSAKSEIVLKNGASKENVFWFLGTALTMGADSTLVGNVFTGTAITMGTNAEISGRAIAQTAVTCETACTIII
jgi:hypothetical protein